MSRSALAVWDEAFLAYDFGAGHPLAPRRLDLTMRLARQLDVLDHLDVVAAPAADDQLLGLVHDSDYIDAVRRASADPEATDLARGLGSSDNPTFAGMHEASALVAGASTRAADAVWSGSAEHAIDIAGGLHHAMPDRASGFCVYNDPAIAIAWLLSQGARRIAYVDVDVHHGDGVQHVFWNEPRVLTISLHESGRFLFPGTGFPDETGGPDAPGSAVNVALPPGTGDAGWLRAFHAIVPALLRSFRPEVLVSQHGCDSHFLDPLAHLTLSVDGQRGGAEAIHRLAHETAGGRWVATGGGGYAITEVVPRIWTHLLAELAGHPVAPQAETPVAWRAYVREITGEAAPAHMTDGREPRWAPFNDGHDLADPVDQAIAQTRAAVFPAHEVEV